MSSADEAQHPLAANDSQLMGYADVDAPLVGATLTIKDLDGRVLSEHHNATGSAGVFLLDLPMALPAGFLIELRGGTHAGAAFAGSLAARLEAHRPGNPVPVNLLTTISARYAEQHTAVQGHALANVAGAVRVPESVIIDAWREFDGSVDGFVDQLTGRMASDPTLGLQSDSSMWGSLLKFAGKEILKGIGGKAAEEGIGWLVSLITGGEQDIENKVDHLSEKLDAISKQITELHVDVNHLLTEIRAAAIYFKILDQFVTIQNLWGELTFVQRLAKEHNRAKAAEQSAVLLQHIASNLTGAVDLIRLLTTAPHVGESLYAAVSDYYAGRQADGIGDINETEAMYTNLFGFVTALQVKALILWSELLHADKIPNEILTKKAEHDTAVTRQAQEFLAGVEKIFAIDGDHALWETERHQVCQSGHRYRRIDNTVGGALALDNLLIVRLIFDRDAPASLKRAPLDHDWDPKIEANYAKLASRDEGPKLRLQSANGKEFLPDSETTANDTEPTLSGLNLIDFEYIRKQRKVRFGVRRYAFYKHLKNKTQLERGAWTLSNRIPDFDMGKTSPFFSPKARGEHLLPFELKLHFDGSLEKLDAQSLPLYAYAPPCMFVKNGAWCESPIRGGDKAYLVSHYCGHWRCESILSGVSTENAPGSGTAWIIHSGQIAIMEDSTFSLELAGKLRVGLFRIRRAGDGISESITAKSVLFVGVPISGGYEAEFKIAESVQCSLVQHWCHLGRWPLSYGDWVRIRSDGELYEQKDRRSGTAWNADGKVYLDESLNADTNPNTWFTFLKA